jgi:glucokinase
MKILSIDIGGTHSRFLAYDFNKNVLKEESGIFRFSTRHDAIHSFNDLISVFEEHKPDGFKKLNEYDWIAIGIAGPVVDGKCLPPNIDWSVDLNYFSFKERTLLINDFVAQAYGLLYPGVFENLQEISVPNREKSKGNIAVMGAGTGLGHCCLFTRLKPVSPIATA